MKLSFGYRKTLCLALLALTLGFVACGDDECADGEFRCDEVCYETPEATLSSLQRTVFTPTCATETDCHGNSGLIREDLLMATAADTYERTFGVRSAQDDSLFLVNEGNAAESFLFIKVVPSNQSLIPRLDSDGNTGTALMPTGSFLCDPQINAIEAWINAGALNN